MGTTSNAKRPADLVDVEGHFRRRWQEADREMLEHMRRVKELHRLIVERKTKAGRPLTKAGAERLLRELEGHAVRATYLSLEGDAFCSEVMSEERDRLRAARVEAA